MEFLYWMRLLVKLHPNLRTNVALHITDRCKASCELNNEIMRYTFEEEFRLDHPETVGETDSHFDLDNYKDWLEAQLIEARKQLALYNVVGRSEQLKCPKCGSENKRVHNMKTLKCDDCGEMWVF